MKSRKLHFLISLLYIGMSFAYAQNNAVIFEANLSKNKLGVNERLRVVFTMNKDGDNFNPPSFKNFKVIAGPTQQISSSFLNGKRSYSKSYTYVVQPLQKGSFEIGQASIEIQGETYKTITQKVEVTAAVENPNAPKSAASIAEESLFLVAEVSNTNPYENQGFFVRYKLYIDPQVNVTNFRPIDNPSYPNFWNQEIPINQYTTEETTYKGKRFRAVILKRVVLYPQKSGKLEIEPFALDVSVDVPTSRRDFFGRPMYASANKVLTAGKRSINVKALPTAGKPDSFTGGVGDFDFSIEANRTQLDASESLQIEVKITGNGNLKLMQLPDLQLPSSLEVYEPEFNENILTNLGGMKGDISKSYTVVPSYKGSYPVQEIAFSYFNPKTKKYVTKYSEPITIEVINGPSASEEQEKSSSFVSKMVVPTTSSFHFIKVQTNFENTTDKGFEEKGLFYVLFALPFILLLIYEITKRSVAVFRPNDENRALRSVQRLAKKHLSEAHKALDRPETFYTALEQALFKFLQAKLKIDISDITKSNIEVLLKERQIESAIITRFIDLIELCELARYSSGTIEKRTEAIYKTAVELLSDLDKRLK